MRWLVILTDSTESIAEETHKVISNDSDVHIVYHDEIEAPLKKPA